MKYLNSLTTLLDYCEEDEKKHYESSGKPKGHIYEHIQIVRELEEKLSLVLSAYNVKKTLADIIQVLSKEDWEIILESLCQEGRIS